MKQEIIKQILSTDRMNVKAASKKNKIISHYKQVGDCLHIVYKK